MEGVWSAEVGRNGPVLCAEGVDSHHICKMTLHSVQLTEVLDAGPTG
jgi:hypothetical protein